MPMPSSNPSLQRLLPAALASAMLLLAGCASEPPPREQLAVSRAAVERVAGPAAAEAPDDVAAARDKINRANVAMASKDYVLARQLAEQAEADAALAEARARSQRSSDALGEVRKSIQLLRTELSKP
jgi:predicted Zn-dependent protease with MMP-like domain